MPSVWRSGSPRSASIWGRGQSESASRVSPKASKTGDVHIAGLRSLSVAVLLRLARLEREPVAVETEVQSRVGVACQFAERFQFGQAE